MAHCIILSRVSTNQQELDSQTQAIENEALRCGFSESDFIVIEDKESAIKLSEEERNGLNRMKEEIAKHDDVTHVFIYELSRLSRRQLVLFSIRDYLIERGIQLVCCTPYFRLLEDGKLSQTANLMFSIFASMAESEMSLKQERMKRGRNRNKENGKLHCGKVLYGYKTLDDRTIVIDEEQKQFVIDMFTMYSTGMYSIAQVAREMMQKYGDVGDNMRMMTGKVNFMLKNKNYMGNSQYPQIISKEMFDRCREVARRNTNVNHTFITDTALLKKIIYSKESPFHMTYSSNSGYPKYSLKGVEGLLKPLSIRCKVIDKAVWELAVALHKAYITDSGKVRGELEAKVESLLEKIMNLRVNCKKIDEKIDKIEERLIYNKISSEKAEQMEDELKKDKARNIDLIAQYEEEARNLRRLLDGPMEMPDYSKFNREQKIDIIRQMIKRVDVWKESRYKPMAEVYTNVDGFRYIIEMDSWNEKYVMRTEIIK